LPPLLIGFGIWLAGLPEHGTRRNQPLLPSVDLADLRRAIHGDLLEAPEGAHSELARAGELTTGEVREGQSSQSRRAANARAIALLVGSSVLGVIVSVHALGLTF
jgi:hypothetical protein